METPVPTDGSCEPTEFLDHESEEVQRFVRRALSAGDVTPRQKAVKLYYAVRDGILYEIYGADLSRSGLRASQVLRSRTGMCVHKSIVYAAALRAVGIPSRLVLTDVRNHLASDRIRELVGGDVFAYHCLVAVHVDGRWLKATPVFNKALCRLYGMAPLEFDGTEDSLHHPFDLQGRRHMELVRLHGEFDDLPYQMLVDGLRAASPGIFAGRARLAAGSLVSDARTGLQHQRSGTVPASISHSPGISH